MSSSSRAQSAEQAAQDAEYSFPYHYVPQLPDQGFRQHFVDTWGINYVSTIEFILDCVGSVDARSVVDIGCGDGRLTREVALRFPDLEVAGIDYSHRAIALARAMNPDLPRVRFDALDITSPEVERTHDVALLMEVYEHVPLDRTAVFLDGVRRRLKPGGTLLLTVPHANKPLEYKHVQHFTVASLVRDLEPHFEVMEVRPFERRSSLRRWVNRLLCNRLFVLQHPGLLRTVYGFYRRRLVHCPDEQSCQRIFVRATARP
jgi:2-polyprenyl-3-methyl-5-hydroxy-6-metoxy-1,4-benzoquinol methylase